MPWLKRRPSLQVAVLPLTGIDRMVSRHQTHVALQHDYPLIVWLEGAFRLWWQSQWNVMSNPLKLTFSIGTFSSLILCLPDHRIK